MAVKVKSCYCGHCKKQVMAVVNGHGVRNGVAVGGALATLGLSLLATKSAEWICPDCGQLINGPRPGTPAAKAARKQIWACEKNGHTLSRNRTVCPIDGSPVGWREP